MFDDAWLWCEAFRDLVARPRIRMLRKMPTRSRRRKRVGIGRHSTRDQRCLWLKRNSLFLIAELHLVRGLLRGTRIEQLVSAAPRRITRR